MELLYRLMSSLVGIPMDFSGDELASLNDYANLAEKDHASDNRWMHGPRPDWSAAARRDQAGSREDASSRR